MELISNYMRDDGSRHMLNELTRNTFGFDFENWVKDGYFEGDYIPFSFADGGKIVSNVSANIMKFDRCGTSVNYIQIGTVMTDASYRRRGLAATLINTVIERYQSSCDGIYLFGNLEAAGFYEKMGFTKADQYRYFIKDEVCAAAGSDSRVDPFMPVNNMDEEVRAHYRELVRTGARQSSFEHINRYGLQMFYTAGFDNVYYARSIDCFAVLGHEDITVLQSVVCSRTVRLEDILSHLELKGGRVRLGFTPLSQDMDICRSERYDGGSDYRLFHLGEGLTDIERSRLYFPELSHA